MALLKDKTVGLALGGGVVRGFAHVGVLEVLEENGVPIDVVAGTSVGAVIGAFYCAGLPLNMVEALAADMSWWRIARPVLSRDGFLSFEKLECWLTANLGDLHFEDLATPFACTATDMETGETVIFDSGPLAPAVRASCSVPGIVTPVRRHGRILCDGSISDTVPVDVLQDKDADFVIGVDIFMSTYKRSLHLGPLGRGLTAIEILVRQAGGGLKEADCLIAPDLSDFTYLRFGKRNELIARGRRAAQAKLDCIQQALQAAKTTKV